MKKGNVNWRECRRATLLCWNSKGSSRHTEEVGKLVNRRWALCLLFASHFLLLQPPCPFSSIPISPIFNLNLNPSISTKATWVWKDLGQDKKLAEPINLHRSLATHVYGPALHLLLLVSDSYLLDNKGVQCEGRRKEWNCAEVTGGELWEKGKPKGTEDEGKWWVSSDGSERSLLHS